MKTIIVMYDELSDAYQTIEELGDAGIARSNVSLVTGDPTEEYAPYFQQQAGSERNEPVEGALAGGAIGGIAGLLPGLETLVIPGIGPVVAAGPLVSGLMGAGIGAAAGSLLSALVNAGVPEEEAGYYLESVRRGGTLVAVKVMSYQADDVLGIMERNNPIDLDERVESWRDVGWSGFEAEAESGLANATRPTLLAEEGERRFHPHYQQSYATSGYDYAHFAPAYRFGYLLADDMRYQDRSWNDIEPVVRERWKRDHIGDRPWEEVKDAIRHAWQEALRE